MKMAYFKKMSKPKDFRKQVSLCGSSLAGSKSPRLETSVCQ